MKYILLFLALALIACNNPDATTGNTDSTGNGGLANDTTTVTLDTFQRNTKTPNGLYGAILPCADCKGREHTVAFSPDLTYRLEEQKLGSKVALQKASGLWRANGGKVYLYKNDTVIARYTWQGDTLQYLQADGAAYALRRLSPAIDNPAWQKKGREGVEFYGVGNEPFWNVEVDVEKGILFHLAEWPKPLRFPASTPIVFPDSTVYITANDSASIRLVILNEFCSDGMSDYTYTERLKVTFRGQSYNGCGIRYKEGKASATPHHKGNH